MGTKGTYEDFMVQETVPADVYHRHMLRAMADHSYFSLLRSLTLVNGMKKLDAMLLSDLINRSEMMFRRRAKLMKRGLKKKAATVKVADGGWFACSVKFLQSKKYPPVWTRKEQEKHVGRLVYLGFIKSRRQGNDGMRWITVNIRAVNDAMDKAECLGIEA